MLKELELLINMINLLQYDKVKDAIDRTKTWFDAKNKVIRSKEIKFKPHSLIVKRWSTNNSEYEYFIIFSDIKTTRSFRPVRVDDYGRLKIRCEEILSLLMDMSNGNNFNIDITEVEKDDNCIVYKLDI